LARHRGRLGGAAAVALSLLLAVSAAQAPAAGAAATVAGAGDRLQVGAWLPYWQQGAASRSVRSERGIVGSASPFWFEARSATEIAAYPGADDAKVLSRLRRSKIAVIPTITSSMSPKRAVKQLGRERSRRKHVRTVVKLARRYDGVDFNYEYPALTTNRRKAKRVRRALSLTFEDACRALQRRGLICAVTVMPRTSDRPSVWRGKLIPWVYDYERIGRAADRVRVMAYDQHAPGTAPGPIAGKRWVQRVARYAARHAGKRRVELGIPLYGRDWPTRGRAAAPSWSGAAFGAAGAAGGGAAETGAPWFHYREGRALHDRDGRAARADDVRTLSWRQAESLRRSVGARRRFSRKHAAPWFHYGGRTVWYSNGRSVGARARIARRRGLRGVYLWAPGAEDPKSWTQLRKVREG
jgi:spore germination protein